MFKSSSPNFYQVLQVSPCASSEVIEAVYRSLARTYHPDLNRDSDTTEKMQAINVAYAVLADPEKRRAYDLSLAPPIEEPPKWKWSQMTWPTRISFVCIVLSIVSMIGIIQNLVSQHVIALDSLRNLSAMGLAIESGGVTTAIPTIFASSSDASTNVGLSEEGLAPDLPTSIANDLTGVSSYATEPLTVAQVLVAQPDNSISVAAVPTSSILPTSISNPIATPTTIPINQQSAMQPAVTDTDVSSVAVPPSDASSTDETTDVHRSGLGQKVDEPINDIRPIQPFPGAEVGGLQTFEWFAVESQLSTTFVELIFWKDGADPFTDGFGVAAPTRASSLVVNLDELDSTLQALLEPGNYWWGLAGVEVVPEYRRVRMLSTGQRIRFNNYGLARKSQKEGAFPSSGE